MTTPRKRIELGHTDRDMAEIDRAVQFRTSGLTMLHSIADFTAVEISDIMRTLKRNGETVH